MGISTTGCAPIESPVKLLAATVIAVGSSVATIAANRTWDGSTSGF